MSRLCIENMSGEARRVRDPENVRSSATRVASYSCELELSRRDKGKEESNRRRHAQRAAFELRNGVVQRKFQSIVLIMFFGCLGLQVHHAAALANPPHLRACPGPLDFGNSHLCAVSGNVSLTTRVAHARLDQGQIVLIVERLGGFRGKATISYTTVNGTARSGIDFVAVHGLLTWKNHDGSHKIVVLHLIDPQFYVLGKFTTSFILRLSDPFRMQLGSVFETEIRIENTNALTGRLFLPSETVVVSENAGSVSVNVTRSGGSDCDASAKWRTVAIPGSDYGHYGLDSPLQRGTLEWLEGDDRYKVITIPIRNNEQLQPDPGEEFYVELYDVGCAPLGRGHVRVSVNDDDQVGYLHLDTPKVYLRSDIGHATVSVTRVSGATTPVSLDYFTHAKTAVEGIDYVAQTGTVIWRHGQSGRRDIKIQVNNVPGNGLLEKTFVVELAYATGIQLAGRISKVLVTIINVFALPGLVGFKPLFTCRGPQAPEGANCQYVYEKESSTTVIVTRTGGIDGDIAVSYVVSNSSIGSRPDYDPTSGELSWGPGDKSSRTITIPINPDAGFTPIVEFIKVELFNTDPLIPVVDPNSSVIYVGLIDDDGGGSITVEATRAMVNESDGTASFIIRRLGNAIGAASVDWETMDGDALAGLDYDEASDTVSWTDGDNSTRSVTVTLIQDGTSRIGLQFKHFYLRITSFTANTFADPREEAAAVYIVDDGAVTGFALFPSQTFEIFTNRLSPAVASYTVQEDAGSIELVVMRKDGFQGNISVNYHTEDGTAVSENQYRGVTGTFSWEEGDMTNRTISIAIVDDEKFRALAPETHFMVALTGFAFHGMGFTSRSYSGPQKAVAKVSIFDNDGGGILDFAQPSVQVDESAGSVSLWVTRRGGSDYNVSVEFTTVARTAQALLHEEVDGIWVEASFATSCAGAESSGVRLVQGAGGVVREVYCDMSGEVVAGSGSIFHWDLSTMLWERECAMVGGNRGADGSTLWTDLSARVGTIGGDGTAGQDFVAVEPGVRGGSLTAGALDQRPASVGGRARPVPFPHNNKTVWFDWESEQLVWSNWSGGEVQVNFSDIGINGTGGMDSAANDFYFISDGIGACHVGARSELEQNNSAVLLTFSWIQGSVTSHNASGLQLARGEWCSPVSDPFGHLLWTVNGRVLFRNCSRLQEEDALHVVLGGTIDAPSARADWITLSRCPEEWFGDCAGWAIQGQANRTGLDVLSHVDADGFVRFGDGGTGGGLFGCGDGDHFGSVRSGIELGREVKNDYMPQTGTLTWMEGDNTPKEIQLQIVADGVTDARAVETLDVVLSYPRLAGLMPGGGTARVSITDLEGPGAVNVAVSPGTNSPVGEREECCLNCADSFPQFQKLWCTGFEIQRTRGRGPVCVNYALQGEDSGALTAVEGTHFLNSSGTLCWANNDTSPRTITAQLPYHPSYDIMHKTFALALYPAVSLEQFSVTGSTYQSNASAAVLGEAAVQTIEDEDMNVGFLTFKVNPLTGASVFAFNEGEASALLQVERIGGTDLDLAVRFETVLRPEGVTGPVSKTRIAVAVPVSVRDGSRGSNTFCISDDYKIPGACVDSSGAVTCEDDKCVAIVNVFATPATPSETFGADGAQYLGYSGKLRWKEGEGGVRGVMIPLFYPEPPQTSRNQTNVTGTNATSNVNSSSYRFFAVQLTSAQLSSQGERLAAAAPEGMIRDANAKSDCTPAKCREVNDDVVISRCTSFSCRRSDTSEAMIAVPSIEGSGTIRIVNTTFFIPEDIVGGAVLFPVKRFGGSEGRVSVGYRTYPVGVANNVSVPALPGQEFDNVTGRLTWSNGERVDQMISVPIYNDDVFTRGRLRRSFEVELFDVEGGAALSTEESQRRSVLIIVDDDANTGTVQMHETRRTVLEGASIATLEVARVGGTDLDVYMRYHTGLGTLWSTPSIQTGNFTAHSEHIALQTYACQTSVEGTATASVFTALRGGGGPELAFDQDPNTFWDASNSVSAREFLTYHFATCELLGAKVTGYTFYTLPTSPISGCPAEWNMQGSKNGYEWQTIDSRGGRTCSPTGSTYTLAYGKADHYLYYRWLFTKDVQGFVGVRVNEVVLEFANEGVADSFLRQGEVCNDAGQCCVFGDADCEAWGGSSYEQLRDMSYDFTYSSGLLHWPEGDMSVKTISITVIDDCMGCAESTCSHLDQQQDKPLETVPLQLSIPSDRDVRELTGSELDIYPFRKDATLSSTLSTGTVVILDDDGPGVLELSALSCGREKAGYEIAGFTSMAGVFQGGNNVRCPILESAGSVEFLVSRVGGNRGSIEVEYFVEGLTAQAGVDFEPTSGTMVWSDGDDRGQMFAVRISKVSGYQAGRFNRTLVARLNGTVLADGTQTVVGGAQLSDCRREVESVCVDPGRSEFEVMVIDEDASPGIVSVDRADLPVAEQYDGVQEEGEVNITVTRNDGNDLPVEVFYETVQIHSSEARPCFGTTPDESRCEYYPVSGTLRWEDGEDGAKTISVRISQGVMRRPFQKFKFRITGVLNTTIGECGAFTTQVTNGELQDERVFYGMFCDTSYNSEATVTLVPDSPNGYFEMTVQSWPMVVSTAVGDAWVVISRVGGNLGIVSAQLQAVGITDGGTAVEGVHFLDDIETLSWYDGEEGPRLFAVPILAGSVTADTLVSMYVKVVFYSANSGVEASKARVRVNIRSPQYRHKFLQRSVTESSLVQLALNTLTVHFQTNGVIGPGGQVVISGIVNSGTPSTPAMDISGAGADVFGYTGVWLDTGTLTLTVIDGKVMEYKQDMMLSFTIENGRDEQASRILGIQIYGPITCDVPSVDGIAVTCPESFSIGYNQLQGAVISYRVLALQASSNSWLCTYEECPHTDVFGAFNNVSVTVQTPVPFDAGSTIIFSGLGEGSPPGLVDGYVLPMSLSNLVATGNAELKQKTAACVCYSAGCTCEQTFSSVLPQNATLSAKLQCNNLGWGALGGQEISIRVGAFDTYSSLSGGVVIPPPYTCEDNCGEEHELFSPKLDIADKVSGTGEVYVAITSTSSIDFCGKGEFLRVNLTVEWYRDVTDRIDLDGIWNQTEGTASFVLPAGYQFSNLFDIFVMFPLRNPQYQHEGSTIWVQVTSPDGSFSIGPDKALGDVMVTRLDAAIASTEIGETNPVQGDINRIVIQFAFNCNLGGNRDGILITVSGLVGSSTPSTEALPVQSCSVCRFPSETYLDLSTLVETADWNQQTGKLTFLLRGSAPTYFIERQNIVGMVALRNADSERIGSAPILKLNVEGELVSGASSTSLEKTAVVSGEGDVLSSFVSMDIFTASRFSYGDATSGYTGVDTITISFTSTRALMYSDSLIFTVPSLTTCEVLCYGGQCQERGCASIQGVYLDAGANTSIAGGEENFFLMSWDEQQSQLRLTTPGGRAICAGQPFELSITPAAYGCDDYDCALKVLPDDIGAARGANLFATNALGCAAGGPFCSPPRTSSFTNSPVVVVQGSYWGQGPGRIDEANGTEPVGRAGFAAQVHAGSLFVLGGIGPGGLATDVRVTDDGLAWRRSGAKEVAFGERMLLPTVSFRGYLWVLGGREGHTNSGTGRGLNDVWRSLDGADWCVVTTAAAWSGREQHAAMVHNGRMWVLGGVSDIGGSDVWYSSEGAVWKVATWSAAFGERAGAAAVSFRDRMWVYGGGAEIADVWQSSNGVQWDMVSPTAPWENRRFQGGLIYDSKMWVVGGFANFANESYSDVWYSADGGEWVQATSTAQWGTRFGASAVAFNNRLWLLGGSVEACDGVGLQVCEAAAQGAGCDGYYVNCSGNDAWMDSYVALTFQELQLRQSSTVQGADNRVSLEAIVEANLVTGQQLSLSPFNAEMPDGEIAVTGPSARVVGRRAMWNRDSKTITLTMTETLQAGTRLSVAWNMINAPGEVVQQRVLVSAEGRSDTFARLAGSTWAVFGGVEVSGEYELSTADEHVVEPMVVDGGAMFDVTAMRSVRVGGLSVGLQPSVVGQPLEQEVTVMYKEGSHATAMHNLSEWRVLGKTLVTADVETYSVYLDFADLDSYLEQGEELDPARCPALNHRCEEETVCTWSQCMCSAGLEMQLAQNVIVDEFPYLYAPSEFSQGTTYCGYGNRDNISTSCVGTDGDVFGCVPNIDSQQMWLGPQPTWAENNSDFMSSTIIRNVSITKVITQAEDGLWHSGNGDRYDSEVGCVHLPWCPVEWEFNKDQWLAFDLGECHSLSAFRTNFPNYTQIPDYFFKGVRRLNIREEYWRLAHYKDFEFQYSTTSLSGPWITALKAVANIQEHGWQTFQFEPATARYWRLLMTTNYGFGYTAVKNIEFFGFPSVWCHQSSWCDESPLCDASAADVAAISWDREQNIRKAGLELAAGRHAFYLRTTLALNMSKTTEQRGSIQASDGRIALHHGSMAEYHLPLFAYEGNAAAPRRHGTFDARALTSELMNSPDGFVLVTRFRTWRGVSDGTLVSIGEPCAGGLRVRVKGMAVRLEQGCSGHGEGIVVVGGILNVTGETDYSFVVSYFNATVSLRLERSFPLVPAEVERASASLNLSNIPPFSSIIIGAAQSCGFDMFPGAVSGVSVYTGHLEETSLSAAVRRKCPAVLADGVCTERVDFVEQSVPTEGATDWAHMRLPARPACYRYFRLRVTTTSKTGRWCLREMSFFSREQPNWQPILVSPSRTHAMASSFAPDQGPELAFDGNVTATGMGDEDDEFCSEEGSGQSGWLQYMFDDRTCITGYALHASRNVTGRGAPSTWSMQGSVDGKDWKLVDSRAGETFQRGEWRRYSIQDSTDYLFVSNFVEESGEFGFNTLSRLYGWIGYEEGWVLEQEIPTRGAKHAMHFSIGVEHFLLVSNMADGSVESAIRNAGQRSTSSQVGSDLFLWSDLGFVPSQTLTTNTSASVAFLDVNGRQLLVAADQRAVPYGDRGLEFEASIVFEKESSADACSASDCQTTGTCGCVSCSCFTTMETTAMSAGILDQDEEEHEPAVAWDGDSWTVWKARLNQSGYVLAHSQNISDTLLDTAQLGLAIQLSFTNCPVGAKATWYSLITTDRSCPFGWELQGELTGTWTVLDVQTEQQCSPSPGGQTQPMSFRIMQPSKYTAYRLVFALETMLSEAVRNGTADASNSTLELADVALVFDNQDNVAEFLGPKDSVRSYEFEPAGPPFLSVYRDTDGWPVPAFRSTASEVVDTFGPLDIQLMAGSLVQDGGCNTGGNDGNASWWGDPLAPWRSCVAAPDQCEPTDQGVCFQGNTTGTCLAGNNSGSWCQKDSECGAKGTCAPQTRYSYRVRFKHVVRLIKLRMRGCGFCSGQVQVLDFSGTLLGKRTHGEEGSETNCSACNSWTLPVNVIGREFTITESSFAPLLVRTAISLEWERTSGWREVQLIPTQGANDVEPFYIGADWYIAIANFRQTKYCYGDIGCTNPVGASPLVSDMNLPYNVFSQILKYNGSEFEPVQDIPTLGALDWEHFVISGEHFLAVANSFDSSLSTAEVESVIYKYIPAASKSSNTTIPAPTNFSNTTAPDMAEWVPYQRITTIEARKWTYFEKDGRHWLALACAANFQTGWTSGSSLYLWNGHQFDKMASISPERSASDIEVLRVHDSFYLAVAATLEGDNFATNSSILRWVDATAFHGGIAFTDAYSPSAFFPLRTIFSTSTTADELTTINITFRADRTLPAGARITISGLAGTNTIDEVLPLSGPTSQMFVNAEAEWMLGEASAVLPVAQSLFSNQTHSVSFELRNGFRIQPAKRPTISCGGPVAISPMTMEGPVLAIDTLPPPSVNLLGVGQSSDYQYAINNLISVTFRANFALTQEIQLQISGLTGTATPFGFLELSGPDARRFGLAETNVTSLALFNISNGTVLLIADVLRYVPPLSTVSVSFTMANEISRRDPVQIQVQLVNQTSVAVLAKSTKSAQSILGFNLAPTLLLAKITDTHNRYGGLNRLFVTLQPSVPLVEGTIISITNLNGNTAFEEKPYPLLGPQSSLFTEANWKRSPSPPWLELTIGPRCAYCSRDPSSNYTFPESEQCDCSFTIPADTTTSVWIDIQNGKTSLVAKQPKMSFTYPPGSPLIPMSGTNILGPTHGTPAMNLTFTGEVSTAEGPAWPELLGQVTVEFWLLLQDSGVMKRLLSVGSEEFAVDAGVDAVRVWIKGVNTTLSSIKLNANDDKWRHVVVSWDSGTGRVYGRVTSYTPPVNVNSQPTYVTTHETVHGVSVGDSISASGANISLGSASNQGGQLYIAEVRVWSVARDAASSSPSIDDTLMMFLSGASRPASLLALFQFDVGAEGTDGSIYSSHLSSFDNNAIVEFSTDDSKKTELPLPLDNFVYPPPSFPALVASSSEAFPGGDSCVSLAVQSDVDFGQGVEMTISNLHNLQTLPPQLSITSNFTSQAAWDRTAGSLTFSLTSPLVAGQWLNLSFVVPLPLSTSLPRQLQLQARDGTSLSYGDSYVTPGKATIPSEVLGSAPLNEDGSCPLSSSDAPHWEGETCPDMYGCPLVSLADVSQCGCTTLCPRGAWKTPPTSMALATEQWDRVLDVSDSTSLGARQNRISFSLRPDRAIPAGSNITISGLVTSLTTDRSAGPSCAISGVCFLEISGASKALFETNSGRWEQAAGLLSLTLAGTMPSSIVTEFSFVLQNGIFEQAAVVPLIEISGSVPIPPVSVCGSVMQVIGTATYFVKRELSEATCSPCQSNELTMTLQSSENLVPNSTITVTGLMGSLTPTGAIQILGPDRHLVVDGLGHWTASKGQLLMTLATNVLASTTFIVGLSLHNPKHAQDPRTPTITLTIPGFDAPALSLPMEGFALSSRGEPLANASRAGAESSWMATGWEGWYDLGIDWLETASGACCAGACCPKRSCCACETLRTSGMPQFRSSGVYFEGSPCEVYCDMDTAGGGWTLLATVSSSDRSRWLVRANTSEETDLQNFADVPNLWEARHYLVGDSPPDPNRNADFRSWAFFEAAGDGLGAGDQLMVTFGNTSTTAPVPLLQTEGGCLGGKPMAGRLADLEWNCSNSLATPLVNFNRSEAWEDEPVPGPEPCTHACAIVDVVGAAGALWTGETALLGGEQRRFLMLKAGTKGGPDSASAGGGGLGGGEGDFAYLSTELRDEAGRGRGLGSLCMAGGAPAARGGCGLAGAAEGEGGDVGRESGSDGVFYSVWARREGWTGECIPPLWRQGERCVCCSCPPGMSGDGAECKDCPRGRYKREAGTGRCEVCAGTEVLPAGQSECPLSLEVYLGTKERVQGGGGLEPASFPWFSVRFKETGAWSRKIRGDSEEDRLYPPISEALTSTFTANTTARLLAAGLPYVGTPSAVRYGMDPRANSDVWVPHTLTIRANGGRWYGTNVTGALPAANAVCRAGAGCHWGAGIVEVGLMPLGSND